MPPGLRPPSMGAHANRARARLADSTEIASMHFAVAQATFDSLGIAFWRAVAELEQAERLAAAGQPADATPLAASARAAFAELRATPWLARAGAIAEPASAEPVG
jgi:hypothetical protein